MNINEGIFFPPVLNYCNRNIYAESKDGGSLKEL